jgi:hypothetical protein
MRFEGEGTYPDLIGPLDGEPTVAAACIFVDPVADIALLGEPDNQTFYEQSAAYDDLVASIIPFKVADAPKMVVKQEKLRTGHTFKHQVPSKAKARVLSLNGKWTTVKIERHRKAILIDPPQVIEGGMSGSPILSVDGKAIGLVSTDGTHPILWEDLPAWFFRK